MGVSLTGLLEQGFITSGAYTLALDAMYFESSMMCR